MKDSGLLDKSVFSAFTNITTRRLILRDIRSEDASTILSWRKDERVGRHIRRDAMKGMEEALELTRICEDAFAKKEGLFWIGVTKDGGNIIGAGGFRNIDYANNRAEIGGEMAVMHWGRRYAYEALSAMLNYGFEVFKLHSVEARILPSNRAAIHLVESFGFVREALLKEAGYYGGSYFDLAIYSRLRT